MQNLRRAVFAAAFIVLTTAGCQGMTSEFEASEVPAGSTQTLAPTGPVSLAQAAPPSAETAAAETPPAQTPPSTGAVVGVATPADLTLNVDTSANAKPISRYIYGKNFNGSTWAQQPHLTMDRLGGNRWTAYNWENNASNAGSDYQHVSDSRLGGGDIPGEAVRGPVATAQAAGGATLVTVPIAGWVAADKLATTVSGQAVASRFKKIASKKTVPLVYPPVLTDDTVYQDEFVSWLEQQFPAAHTDPAKEIFYSLDNEPDLWSATHSVMHPLPVTYAELLTKSVEYAKTVKTVAPKSTVFGAVSYGFLGFVNLQNASDAAGRDFIDFFLDGAKAAETAEGKRLIDVLDLHWYPEATAGGTRIFAEDTGAEVVAARVQAPRSLWDPTYVETSWISSSLANQPIALVPSMNSKIAAHYPGTKLAFTEYYYGGGAHISGAIAQADVLGVFGREGVFAAALWPMSSDIRFIDAAFRMFRNVDGAGTHFGDTSVKADSSDVATATVYASKSTADGKVVMVVINKATTPKTTSLALTHATALAKAEVYQLSGTNPAPVKGTDVLPSAPNSFTLTLPAMSVTTLVLN